jgi:hypothetical protein
MIATGACRLPPLVSSFRYAGSPFHQILDSFTSGVCRCALPVLAAPSWKDPSATGAPCLDIRHWPTRSNGNRVWRNIN